MWSFGLTVSTAEVRRQQTDELKPEFTQELFEYLTGDIQ